MRFLGYQCGQETASFRTAIDNRPPAARQRIVDIVPETDGLPEICECHAYARARRALSRSRKAGPNFSLPVGCAGLDAMQGNPNLGGAPDPNSREFGPWALRLSRVSD